MVKILIKGLTEVLSKVVLSLFTEKMLEWMLWKVARLIVESTKTPHDDAFLDKLEGVYNEKGAAE